MDPSDPYAVFRWLPREQRAEYVRRMRGTFAVANRDLGRALVVQYRDAGLAFASLHELSLDVLRRAGGAGKAR